MELIKYTDYKSLCKYSFENGEFYEGSEVLKGPAPSGPIFVHMGHIYFFFKRIQSLDKKYVVVSAASDYGLTNQAQDPVWFDMVKWIQNFVNVDAKSEYSPVLIPARCDHRFCKIDDKYSIKMHSWTGFTIDSVPVNVARWYATNINVDHPKVTRIPFGIPDWTYDKILARRQKGEHLKQKRPIDVFYSCSPNNVERMNLFNALRQISSGPVGQQLKIHIGDNMPHDDYVAGIFNSKYVLCPEGNGYDSFRVLEAIYAGAVPVLRGNTWNQVYQGLPVIYVSDWGQILKLKDFPQQTLDNTTADMVEWRYRITSESY